MAIARYPESVAGASEGFTEISDASLIMPADLGAWRQFQRDDDRAYLKAGFGEQPLGEEQIAELLGICALTPEQLLNEGEHLNKNEVDPDPSSTVVKLGDYAVKSFIIEPGAHPWEWERRAGLSALQIATMLEVGLPQTHIPSYSADQPFKLSTPHIYGCFHPGDSTVPPYWIMSYEAGEPFADYSSKLGEVGKGIAWELLHRLQANLDRACSAVLLEEGPRLIDTLVLKNCPRHWLVRETDKCVDLIKLGACCIKKDPTSEAVWRFEQRYLRGL